MTINVISGYAALRISNNNKWIGYIAGNIRCNKPRRTASKALEDAKEFYNNFYCS